MKKVIAVTGTVVLAAAMSLAVFMGNGVIAAEEGTGTETKPEENQEDLKFSHDSGYYANKFSLTIEGEGVTKILYTLDGSEPVEGKDSTKVYSEPVSIENRKGKTPVLATNENSSEFTDNGWANVPSKDKLDRATIVRAVGITEDGEETVRTRVSTRTYFVGNNISKNYDGCAVMSIVTDPANLLDPLTGIYVLGSAYKKASYEEGVDIFKKYVNFMQKGKDWERAASMEFFDGSGNMAVRRGVGIRIHGGYSRRNQQKSLNIYFRKDYDYGTKNLKGYELIPGATITYDNDTGMCRNVPTMDFGNVMLRNGGNDVDYTKFQDAFIQSMVTDRDFCTQGARPCMLYLNGEFWGLYNLTEKYSDKYLQEEFDVDKDNVIAYKDLELDEGVDEGGAALAELKALGDLDMTKEDNYNKFLELVDEKSFTDYYATEVYINNNDWWSGCNDETPNNNLMFWKVADTSLENPDNPYADGRWRYMLFDTEWSMSIYGSREAGAEYDSIKYHALGMPDKGKGESSSKKPNGSPVFTAVSKNASFRQKFITTMLDLRNWNFEYERCSEVLDAMSKQYKPLMEKNRDRWGSGNVSGRVEELKDFLSKRQNYVLVMLEDNYSELKSSNRVNVTVNSNVAGNVKVNTVEPEVKPSWFQGVYYKNYPLALKAEEVEGYTFSRWDVKGGTAGDAGSAETEVTLSDASASITAIYKDDKGAEPTVEPSPTPKPTATPRPSWGGGGGWWWPDATARPTQAPKATAKPTATVAAPVTEPEVTKTPAPSQKPSSGPVIEGAAPVATQAPVAESSNADVKENEVKEFTVNGIVYKVMEDGSAAVKKAAKKSVKSVVIPASVKYSGKTYKVKSVSDNAFKNCKKLTVLGIGKNIVSIGKGAFMGCTRLKRINIMSSVMKKAGSSSFKSVNGKAVVTVPASKLKAYRKLFARTGIGSKAVFKKK